MKKIIITGITILAMAGTTGAALAQSTVTGTLSTGSSTTNTSSTTVTGTVDNGNTLTGTVVSSPTTGGGGGGGGGGSSGGSSGGSGGGGVIDVCPNIAGVQSILPGGFTLVNGACDPISGSTGGGGTTLLPGVPNTGDGGNWGLTLLGLGTALFAAMAGLISLKLNRRINLR